VGVPVFGGVPPRGVPVGLGISVKALRWSIGRRSPRRVEERMGGVKLCVSRPGKGVGDSKIAGNSHNQWKNKKNALPGTLGICKSGN